MSPKPRCETCPHFCDENSIDDYGVCELGPPQFVGEPQRRDEGDSEWKWRQPMTHPLQTCSHHPDFPAWLAEWKAERQREEIRRNPPPNIMY